MRKGLSWRDHPAHSVLVEAKDQPENGEFRLEKLASVGFGWDEIAVFNWTRPGSAILSLSIFAAFRTWGVSVEERRKPILGGLTAASLLPTSSPNTPHALFELQIENCCNGIADGK